MNIPREIKERAPEGSTIEYLGKYVGLNAYQAYFPGEKTGFPIVYIIYGAYIKEVIGFDALDIVNELKNDEQ